MSKGVQELISKFLHLASYTALVISKGQDQESKWTICKLTQTGKYLLFIGVCIVFLDTTCLLCLCVRVGGQCLRRFCCDIGIFLLPSRASSPASGAVSKQLGLHNKA